MILDIFKGLVYYLKAIPKIKTFNLWKYFLLLLLTVLFYYFPFLTFGNISLFFSNLFPLKEGANIMAFFYKSIVSISGFILLLILSPFFSIISEIVFKKL
ncbi:MAG TPA: hypothetical protein ENK67_01710, partial [Flavobacteriia bacterium]|nr:hypothetical protein [Flavobacteriia bacterium]